MTADTKILNRRAEPSRPPTASPEPPMDSRRSQERGDKTGWPPGLLQDDDRKLSRWFASRLDARRRVRERCAKIAQKETS